MAKGASRKGQVIEIISTPLEEFVPVKYVVVGRSEWIDGFFEPDALAAAFKIIRVTEPSHLFRVKEWLDKHKKHYIDTEGTGEGKHGLNPLHPKSRLLMLQIGDADLVFVVDPELITEFKGHMEDPQYLHVLQNAVHDWKFIYHGYKVHINNFYDTMLAEQLLTSGRAGMPVNLAAISRRRKPYRIITKAIRQEFVEFKGKFTKDMVYYAVRDVALLPSIVDDQTEQLESLSMSMVARDEFNLIPVTGSMEIGGVPFSEQTIRLSLLYWRKKLNDLETNILKMYDDRMVASGAQNLYLLPELKFSFDVNSQTQKLAALRELGLEIDDVKRDTLEEINDPIATLLGEYSEALKVVSTYGENLIERLDPTTHRLLVEFNQLGHGDVEAKAGKATTIATGRYSSDFQQLPRARNLFDVVVGDELCTVKAQYASQIEQLLKEAGQ